MELFANLEKYLAPISNKWERLVEPFEDVFALEPNIELPSKLATSLFKYLQTIITTMKTKLKIVPIFDDTLLCA